MSSDMTSKEQAAFAEDLQQMKLPIYKTPEGNKVVLNPGSKAPNTLVKGATRKQIKRRSKKTRKHKTNVRSR